MTRRSLRPQLNQIRTWVRQGRTDAWIAHQLEVTVQQIQAFKREQDLEPDGDSGNGGDVDLRATDDEAIAAELEAEAARKAEEEARKAEEEAKKAEEEAKKAEAKAKKEAEKKAKAEAEGEEAPKPRRRRTRRRKAGTPFEGTFDHGDEGYGLWLDPAVEDDPVYAEHWAGHRPVEVVIEEDQIVIRRTGDSED
jgi:hypothetical protein